MDQYRPSYQAGAHAGLSRRITVDEYKTALDTALRLGIMRLDKR